MNNQQILDNAPENATTFAKQGYFDKFDCLLKRDGTWQISDIEPTSPRSLADIRRIVELENALTDAEKIINQLQKESNKCENY